MLYHSGGSTENAGPENEGPMREQIHWRMADQIFTVGKHKTRKCATEKCRTENA